MNMKKKLAMIMSVMMLGAVATACGDSNKGSESKTPHTTYSVDDINNMSNDELEKALENAASEIEMSEKAERESAEEESEAEAIDMWKDVVVSFEGVSGFAKVNIEYVGDNQIIKDNVTFGGSISSDKDITFCYPSKDKDFRIVAIYDEKLLNDMGVKIKKNAPDLAKYEIIDGVQDVCDFPVTGLGEWMAVNDETDMTPYKEMVDSITEKAIEVANDPDENEWTLAEFEWIKNDNIKPKWGAVEKCEEGVLVTDIIAHMEIYYVNEAGDYVGSIRAYEINCFSSNGQWCKDVWMACPDTIDTIYSYCRDKWSIADSFDRWKELNEECVCFEIN